MEGKINGKIKEYNRVGVVIFEGEYINGEKNGYGKEYNDSGILKFEGEYLMEKKGMEKDMILLIMFYMN